MARCPRGKNVTDFGAPAPLNEIEQGAFTDQLLAVDAFDSEADVLTFGQGLPVFGDKIKRLVNRIPRRPAQVPGNAGIREDDEQRWRVGLA